MKRLFPLLSTSLILNAAMGYGDELEETNLEPELVVAEELENQVALGEFNPKVPGFEQDLYKQSSVSREDIDFDPSVVKSKKSVFWAVALANLAPGLGHVYLGDYSTAGQLFGGSMGFLGTDRLENTLWKGDSFKEDSPTLGGIAFSNMLSYNVYAAYRDARIYNDNEGYKYSMPTEGYFDLLKAPFQWSVIKKPEVWGGYLGALVAAVGVGMLFEKAHSKVEAKIGDSPLFPLAAFPVGIGEETFFRGYLQPMFSEYLSPTGGVILSSLMFGAAHIPNMALLDKDQRKNYLTYSVPLITSFGLYFGWLAQKNNSLKESVAVHAWYDFTLFLIGALSSTAATGVPSFSLSTRF